MNCDLNNQKSL